MKLENRLSKIFLITLYRFIFVIFLGISCNSSSSKVSEITNNYIVITTAIRTSKDSRLKFQDKFSTVLDSFFVSDNPLVTLEEQKLLLAKAKIDNTKAEDLISAANEIDSTLRYKEKALEMVRLLDHQYNYQYPEIFKIMESSAKNKKALIAHIIVPCSDSLSAKATAVIEIAESVIKKYDIKLVEVAN